MPSRRLPKQQRPILVCLLRRLMMTLSAFFRRSTCLTALGLIISMLLLLTLVKFVRVSSPTADDDGKSNGKSRKDHGSTSFAKDGLLPSPIYGVIVDAGSTGSRLFVYKWRGYMRVEPVVDSKTGEPISKKVTPGLSSFAEKPSGAADYFKPLLDYASSFIPKKSQRQTPVYIFATAGMRLLAEKERDGILSVLRTNLPTLTRLQLRPENIQVIDGEWEGVYCWVAVNYLLGRFASARKPPEFVVGKTNKLYGISPPSNPFEIDEEGGREALQRQKTVGIIDMGGASVQIAFEVPPDLATTTALSSHTSAKKATTTNSSSSEAITHPLLELDIGHFRHRLFVTTFLGYGVNEVIDGCLPVQYYRVTSDENDEQFIRKGTGDWDLCVKDLQALLFPIADASEKSPKTTAGKRCLALGPDGHRHFFNGVEAPPVPLSEMEIYGFSEYWFSAEDVLALGGPYKHDEFELKARKFCRQRWSEIKNKMRHREYPKADGDRLEKQCFKSAWIHAVLHDGFCINEVRNQFRSAMTLDRQEVQWTLGAIIFQMRDFPLLRKYQDSVGAKREESQSPVKADGADSSSESLFSSFFWMVCFYLLAIAAVGLLGHKLYRLYCQKIRPGSRARRRRTTPTKGRVRSPANFGDGARNDLKYSLLTAGGGGESQVIARSPTGSCSLAPDEDLVV